MFECYFVYGGIGGLECGNYGCWFTLTASGFFVVGGVVVGGEWEWWEEHWGEVGEGVGGLDPIGVDWCEVRTS